LTPELPEGRAQEFIHICTPNCHYPNENCYWKQVGCRPEPDGVYPFQTGNVCARNEIWKHMVSCREGPEPMLKIQMKNATARTRNENG